MRSSSRSEVTIRDLAAHSGNLCAWPGCTHAIIDESGRAIAQLAHIEAAEPGGERFNPEMTNEHRRHRDNRVFLCRTLARDSRSLSSAPSRTETISACPLRRSVKAYCETDDIHTGAIVNDLRFDLLD